MKTKTRTCKICFQPVNETNLYNILNATPLCHTCLKQFNPVFKKGKIDSYKFEYIYNYDDFIKDLLYKFKGCYDYELKDVFLGRFKWYLRIRYFGYNLVPAPSSEEKNEERGFNHVEEMFSCLKLKYIKCIKKKYDFKQSDLTKSERMQVKDKFEVIDGSSVKGKKILIVDDIFTTGSTIRAMIDLLKPYHPRKIKVLTMAKTPPHEESKNNK
ncbi:MAG: hypothetical protein LUD22_01790 [Coprobacillus sp.]|nr:hypothetical protein [Coprobacillus sp.]